MKQQQSPTKKAKHQITPIDFNRATSTRTEAKKKELKKVKLNLEPGMPHFRSF